MTLGLVQEALLDVGHRSARFRRLRETGRARRVATVGEGEVVRCITSRSDQTGKYFSYNFGVFSSLLSDRPIDRPTDRPTDRSTARPTDRTTDRPTDQPTEFMARGGEPRHPMALTTHPKRKMGDLHAWVFAGYSRSFVVGIRGVFVGIRGHSRLLCLCSTPRASMQKSRSRFSFTTVLLVGIPPETIRQKPEILVEQTFYIILILKSDIGLALDACA